MVFRDSVFIYIFYLQTSISFCLLSFDNEALTSKSAKFKNLIVLRLSVVQTQRYPIQVSRLSDRIHRQTDRRTDRLHNPWRRGTPRVMEPVTYLFSIKNSWRSPYCMYSRIIRGALSSPSSCSMKPVRVYII